MVGSGGMMHEKSRGSKAAVIEALVVRSGAKDDDVSIEGMK